MYGFAIFILSVVHILLEEIVGRDLFQFWLPGETWYRILASIGYFMKLSIGLTIWIIADADWVLILSILTSILHFSLYYVYDKFGYMYTSAIKAAVYYGFFMFFLLRYFQGNDGFYKLPTEVVYYDIENIWG